MRTYFAQDGSYGDADGIVVLDTNQWSDYEWNLVSLCADRDRTELAQDINDWLNYGKPPAGSLLEELIQEAYPDEPVNI